MSDLAQVALEFCHECMGWEKAQVRPSQVRVVQDPDQTGLHHGLFYTDLNAVMEAVRGWRDRMQDALDEYVTVTLSCASGQYIGHAFIGTAPPTTATADTPCHALLTACVEASRKLKGERG